MFGFNKYLIEENKRLNKRIDDLEAFIFDLLDAKMFNRLPERLVKEPDAAAPGEKRQFDSTDRPSDALSAAEADAWEKSRPKSGSELVKE